MFHVEQIRALLFDNGSMTISSDVEVWSEYLRIRL
jgi:hypothetical protein